MSEKILVVDDEPDIVETLVFNLEQAGYSVLTACNGASAISTANGHTTPALIILDLMLPDISGLDVCRQLKHSPRTQNIPVIMLTARGHEVDRVMGLELGADDYVIKPFSPRELLLRIRAVLRRSTVSDTSAGERLFGYLRVDTEAHRVWIKDVEVSLTALELRLLDTLLSRKGRVQSRETLLEEVWNMPAELTTRTVDTHVKRLRQKLLSAGEYIQTVRGVGYRFVDGPNLAGRR